MPLTLHDAFIPSCQQILHGTRGLIDKAESHCRDQGIVDSELLEAKLADTMWPLPWHVRACWVHSKLILDLLPTGEFSPDFTELPQDWDAMRAMVDDAQTKLSGVSAEELAEYEDKVIGFVLGGKRLMEMAGSDFLLKFSQPNFYFHATTFYDILRMKDVPLGKRDFMGMERDARQ